MIRINILNLYRSFGIQILTVYSNLFLIIDKLIGYHEADYWSYSPHAHTSIVIGTVTLDKRLFVVMGIIG